MKVPLISNSLTEASLVKYDVDFIAAYSVAGGVPVMDHLIFVTSYGPLCVSLRFWGYRIDRDFFNSFSTRWSTVQNWYVFPNQPTL